MSEFEPRWDQQAEMALLGAALMDARVLDNVAIQPLDFYKPAHGQLWEMITDEARSGRMPTPMVIAQRLISSPIPGVEAAYLHECTGHAPVRSAVPQVADIVVGLARLRQMEQVGLALVSESRRAAWDEVEGVLDKGRVILDQTVSEASGVKVRTFAQALETAVEEWEKPAESGYPTGWSELDMKLNGGWRPGQLTVIGARPAVGKSVIAACAAVAASSYGAGFFSLEMSELEVVARMAAAAQGVELAHLNSGHLNERDWGQLARLASRSQNWNVYIEDKSRITMAQIRATVRTWTRRGPVPLVIIDYSQLVTPADRNEARERQVSRILEDCKHLAKEFDTHVLALAQVNRGSTQREDKRPTMSDLRESGGIEAHADNIILLHRDDKEMEGEIELIIAKNRHGQTGTIRLAWRPAYASANSMAHDPTDYRYGLDQTA